ncbi:MAG: hypothetical protein EA396_01615 [Anaerolineaceae bacterium]|nr:MAG: hypothetical protein EA396_01615 [Anaerolineaceae bacterium]
MFKFMIIFHQPQPTQIRDFEKAYTALLAHVEQMPDIIRRQVSSVAGSPTGASPYYRILEVYFQDRPTMEAAMRSSAGQLAGAQLAQFPEGVFEMAFADVYEESGGLTPTDDAENTTNA